jgi:ParB-like chromosome segregation protein Spo0J
MNVAAWPADRVERRPVVELLANERNSRTHTPEQVAKIAAAIERYGWTTPILIDDDGVLIAGHGRLLAAQVLGLDTVPVMTATGWDDAQKRAYMIADNRLTEAGGWDDEILRAELNQLQLEGIDIASLGFEDDEIDALLSEAAEGQQQEKPAPRDTSQRLDDLKYSVVIRCDGEQHQLALLQELGDRGLRCEALIS